MRRISEWLRQDLWIKFFSVVVAVLLWINVAGTPRASPLAPVQDTAENVPVVWRDVPEGLSVAVVNPYQVSVTFRAPANVADSISSGSFTAFIDLKDSVAGRLAFNVDVAVPPQVQLVSVTPSRVTVTLVPVSSRTFEVTARTSGEPADGYRAGDVRVVPAEVTLSGISDAVGRVAAVVADVDLEGRSTDFDDDVPLQPVDENGEPVSGVTVDPATAHASVPVTRWTTRSVPVSVPVAGRVADGFALGDVSADPATVEISGPDDVVGDISVVYTEPLDVAGATADVKKTLRIAVPQGAAAEPETVVVTAGVAESQ